VQRFNAEPGSAQTQATLFGQLTQDLFSCLHELPFPLHGGFLEVLTLLEFGQNTGLLALPFEAAEGVLEAFFIAHMNYGHWGITSSLIFLEAENRQFQTHQNGL
jgi:hypothetical protein